MRDGIRSSLSCPLLSEGRAVGVVFFSSRQAGTYEQAHVQIFEEIADVLALIIQLFHYFRLHPSQNALSPKSASSKSSVSPC